ncbi:MAG: Rne/Rng family ribonuclease, partial [Elusimicrobiota bacterium]
KDTIGTKGMKITLNTTLPGRYMVLTPHHKQMHVSKQIEDEREVRRLEAIYQGIVPANMGVVVRTESEGATAEDLKHEMQYLMRQWENIQKKFEHGSGPRILYKELSLPLAAARDILSDKISIYLVDSEPVYKELSAFISEVAPALKTRIAYYDKPTSIFAAFNIEGELSKMRRSRLPLKSGGEIVIQEAESITMVDVNTARFVGATTQEETVTQTNIEAAQEVARQLRLRNIGGIIVIDFIDMRREVNRRKITDVMRDAVRNDRARVKIHPITRLGLVEMTRERKRESNLTFLTEACEVCQGSGRVLSKETIFLKVCRELNNLIKGRVVETVKVQVAPALERYFHDNASRLENSLRAKPSKISINLDANLVWEDYKLILE